MLTYVKDGGDGYLLKSFLVESVDEESNAEDLAGSVTESGVILLLRSRYDLLFIHNMRVPLNNLQRIIHSSRRRRGSIRGAMKKADQRNTSADAVSVLLQIAFFDKRRCSGRGDHATCRLSLRRSKNDSRRRESSDLNPTESFERIERSERSLVVVGVDMAEKVGQGLLLTAFGCVMRTRRTSAECPQQRGLE